jgi:YHS domain-containing protein
VSWVLRILLVLLLIRVLWRLLGGVIAGMAEAQGRKGGPVQLVRDPICGTYVVPARALPLTAAGVTQYFCSERCRDQYVSRSQSEQRTQRKA